MIDLDSIQCLADIPGAQARRLGDSPALVCDGRVTSFIDLAARARRMQRALLAMGIGPGDRVAILNRNDDSWFELFFGVAMAGACAVPINMRLAAPEIRFIIQDAAPRLLFVGEKLADTARAAIAGLDNAPELILLNSESGAQAFAMERMESAPPAPAPVRDPDIDVLQLYTSGTTGKPKGVVLTNAVYSAFLQSVNAIDGFSYDQGETVMMVMPLFHVAGTNVSFAALAQGCRLLIMREIVPDDTVRIMQHERVAHAFLAPAIIQMLIATPAIEDARFDALRTISYGASPISEDVLRRAQTAFGCGFVQFYGMTESAGSGTTLAPGDHVDGALLRSCGRPWPGTEAAVLGSDGQPLGPHQIGEIAIRGPLIMRGYWNRADATAEALAGGWLHTGDAGYMDEQGYFYVHDRIKDLIVSGGENVYPAEVENAIQGCPGVVDVAVIGVPDDRWGETVMALIVSDGGEVSPESVIAWSKERIAGFKAPRIIEFVDGLPRNASGKVLRRELRAYYWEGRDRAIG